MEYDGKTRDELLDEIRKLSQRIANLESQQENSGKNDENRYVVKSPFDVAGRTVSFSIDISDHERIRRELQEIRTRYRLILDAMPANISYVDTEQKLRFVNKWHEKWFGFHPKEIVGRNIRDLFGEKLYQQVQGHIQSVLKGSEVTFETTFHNGTQTRHLAVTLVPHKNDEERILGFYILAYDITDRILVEEALRRAEREKDLILDSVTELVIYRDLDFRIVWSNRAACSAIGVSAAMMTGSHCYRIWHRKDRPCEGCPVIEALRTGEPREGEIALPDGRIWYVSGFPVRAEDGKLVGVVEVSRDITARKRSEEKLKKSEMQLAEAQHIANLGSWEFDLQSRSFLWSQEMYRICDIDPREFRLTFKEMLKLIHPDDLGIFKVAIETAYRNKTSFSLYHRIVRPNGTFRILHSQGKVVADSKGNPERIIGSAQDVTARKKAEEALRRKHLELKQFSRVLEKRVEEEVAKNREKDYLLIQQGRQAAMGEMIGNIAHQWRQPLTTVSLLIQNLNESYSYGDFSRDYLEKTVEHAMQVIQYMSQTIDDFRNFFKPDKDKTRFLIRDVIQKTISFVEPSLKCKNIEIRVQAEEGLAVTGYPNEYAQVLLNILSNARDEFVDRGIEKPEILIRAFRKRNKTVVTVSDNAGGIPEGIVDKIFEPYFTTKELGRGTGVGLYMSKTIIEKHMCGRLTARNIKGGAEFRIEI